MALSRKNSSWDVFISYKSRNAELARALADRLIASDLRVWFAEYQILLVERERFQEAIDRAIGQSTFGIALTNDDYAQSDYCGLEMTQMLDHCGPDRILEIMIPEEPLTHRKFGMLDQAHRHLYRDGLDETLQFIGQRTGWRIVSGPKLERASKTETFTGECLGEPYTIDVSGWQLREKSFHGGGPCYSKTMEGFQQIFWNLQYGEEHEPRVYEARTNWVHQADRVLYDSLVDYANHYFCDVSPGVRVKGVHLFFDSEGSSHLALTYQMGKILKVWKRRVSIMLVHPRTGRAAEFLFTFECTGDFKGYCGHSQIMDEVCKSLRWGEGGGLTVGDSPAETSRAPSSKDERLARLQDDQPLANKLYAEGMAYAKQGRLEEAIATWERVLDYSILVELRGATLFNLGRAYEKLGRLETAIGHYKDSVEANPAQFNALCNIGSIYIAQGEYKEALPYLLDAVQQNPEDVATVHNLLVCYEHLDDPANASQWRRRLREIG